MSIQQKNGVICATRALKNLRKIREIAPQLFENENKRKLIEPVPIEIVRTIHTPDGRKLLQAHPNLKALLNDLPFIDKDIFEVQNLFNGSFYIIQPKFHVAFEDDNIFVSDEGMQNVLTYAQMTMQPISDFCAQYGKNSISVHNEVLTYDIFLPNPDYTELQIRMWVDDITNIYGLDKEKSCIVFVMPYGVTDIDIASLYRSRLPRL